MVTSSILASVIGASATMGVVQLAYKSGPSAMLWLGSGAVGLFFSGIWVAARVRDTGAKTLVEAAKILIDVGSAKLITLVIVIAWTGIIAAQFIAAAKLIDGCCDLGYTSSLAITSFLIIGYCVAGGQFSVLKTDMIQFFMMVFGILLTVAFLFKNNWSFNIYALPDEDSGFRISNIAYFMLIVGSGFLIGPDIFSRYFSAGSNNIAKKSAYFSGFILFFISVEIVTIGLWARKFCEIPEGQEALVWILGNKLPSGVGVLLSLGLLSAIISSADTCLITSSAIVSGQFKNFTSVKSIRIVTLFIGVAALAVAWIKADIIKTLLLSYSVFNCGVIAPVFIAILVSKKTKLKPIFVYIAIVTGGSLGLYANFSSNKQLFSIIAFLISVLFSVAAVLTGKKSD